MLDHQNELSEHSCKVPEAVAIVGMACRLPGGATNVEKLWTALASGKSGWSPHPERQAPGAYYHPKPGKAGCYNSKGAHYLDEDIGLFDAQFFGLTSAEANVRPF
jgi:acyl transferase domain-containing protein